MTEQHPPTGATSTLPPQSANGTSPQLPPAARPRRSGRAPTGISGMRTSLIAGFAGRITQLRRIMRRARGKPQAS
jgi:hypothetical protein